MPEGEGPVMRTWRSQWNVQADEFEIVTSSAFNMLMESLNDLGPLCLCSKLYHDGGI